MCCVCCCASVLQCPSWPTGLHQSLCCVAVVSWSCAYVEEAHLWGRGGGVWADQLDKLLQGLLLVVPDGWVVGEVGGGLLQDGGGGEVEAGGGGVGAGCERGTEGEEKVDRWLRGRGVTCKDTKTDEDRLPFFSPAPSPCNPIAVLIGLIFSDWSLAELALVRACGGRS